MMRPVALITGGRRGIGLGIAKSLAAAGFDVAITGTSDSPDNEAVLIDLRSFGGKAIFIKSDLADLSGHESAVNTVTAQVGAIDCLVNNAGMGSVVRGDFLELTPENFDTIIATNLRGTMFFTQAVVKSMLTRSTPKTPRSIINITSVSATMSSPERLDYCVTKAGLAAFTQGLTLRLSESGISVFEVRPGIIRSDMTAKVSGKYDALIADGLVPMKRWGEASDIGTIVSSLAGGSFAFATGSVIHADGALSVSRL